MSGKAFLRLPIALLLLCFAFLASGAVSPLHAQPAPVTQTNIQAALVPEGPAQPGETITLAIRMEPSDGWHGYWLNPGDAGLCMQLDWTLPVGATAGELQYPVPSTLITAGLMNHVYKDDYAVLIPLTLPKSTRLGSILPITVNAQWLACTDEVCVPEQARLETQIMIGSSGPTDPAFDGWRAKLPAPLNADARFEQTSTLIRLAIPLPGTTPLSKPHLFIAQDRAIDYAARQRFSRQGDILVIELERPEISASSPDTISGVLRLDSTGTGLSFTAEAGEVPIAGTPIAASQDTSGTSLAILLFGALVGGLILNIMPCVFPILSLKALSLAGAGESEAQARSEGIAYAAGVIAATVALGGLLLILRAGGEQVGWAFQLQEPAVIVVLLAFSAAITANFLGLFEFSVPGFAGSSSPQGAFATGLLAAFVATPCTGPFMAAAMGAALLLPTGPALALFATLGLGLALPFILVAFIPALRKRLPRPGPWMNSFRRWMAVPMGLTALALLWLASRVGGMNFAIGAAGLTATLVLLLAFAGQQQRKGKSAFTITAAGLAVLAFAGTIILPGLVAKSDASAHSQTGAIAFSQSALDQAKASGKPVFVWMTADWCITCKVNEKVAIEREETLAAFKKAGVIVLRGDWTRRDPEITRYLTAQGAAGVPHYVWHSPDGAAPKQLPQVLTQTMLVNLAEN